MAPAICGVADGTMRCVVQSCGAASVLSNEERVPNAARVARPLAWYHVPHKRLTMFNKVLKAKWSSSFSATRSRLRGERQMTIELSGMTARLKVNEECAKVSTGPCLGSEAGWPALFVCPRRWHHPQ